MSMKEIAIVDYGRGNVRSVQKGFQRAGWEAVITCNTHTIRDARAVVLPGVGAFRDCMENLQRFDLVDAILESIHSGKPFLGICLGLQLLFSESEEFGLSPGLNVFRGKVQRFPTNSASMKGLKIPHIGWNTVRMCHPSPVLHEIPDGSFFYFIHSFFVRPEDPDVVCTETDYGIPFVSSIHKDNVFATQFHPEKSQIMGLQILRNFGGIG
jgi:glutamine amidotransferase